MPHKPSPQGDPQKGIDDIAQITSATTHASKVITQTRAIKAAQQAPLLPNPNKAQTSVGPFRVLLVDHDPQVTDALDRAVDAANHDIQTLGRRIELSVAASIADARHHLVKYGCDLVMVEPNLKDDTADKSEDQSEDKSEDGMCFSQAIAREYPATQTILITDAPDLRRAIEAIRTGASDLIVKPLDLDELNDRVRAAIARHADHNKHRRRVKKLKQICHRLNDARDEVSRQVDTLCNDLVTAYQELASQMQHVVQTQEFAIRIKDELDLEQLLRTTLEHLLDKVGPTNAAIFLPSEADQDYALGGYVNYSFGDEVAELLLQHLADVLSPRVAEATDPVLINNNHDLIEWVGDDFAYLSDCDILAFPCAFEDETLAVVVLFRDKDEPLTPAHVELAHGLAPLVGEHLRRIVRVHHRHKLDALEDAGSTAAFIFADPDPSLTPNDASDPENWGKSWTPDQDDTPDNPDEPLDLDFDTDDPFGPDGGSDDGGLPI